MVLATKRAVGSEYTYPLPQGRPQEKQESKVKQKKASAQLLVTVMGVFLISSLFMTGLAYTFVKARIAQMGWQISQSKKEIAAMQGENEKIKLEIAKLKSLDRIEQIATTKLGMLKNPGIEYLVIAGGTNEAQAEIGSAPREEAEALETAEGGFLQQVTKAFTARLEGKKG